MKGKFNPKRFRRNRAYSPKTPKYEKDAVAATGYKKLLQHRREEYIKALHSSLPYNQEDSPKLNPTTMISFSEAIRNSPEYGEVLNLFYNLATEIMIKFLKDDLKIPEEYIRIPDKSEILFRHLAEVAGYFQPTRNQIEIDMKNFYRDPVFALKILLHEMIHFSSDFFVEYVPETSGTHTISLALTTETRSGFEHILYKNNSILLQYRALNEGLTELITQKILLKYHKLVENRFESIYENDSLRAIFQQYEKRDLNNFAEHAYTPERFMVIRIINAIALNRINQKTTTKTELQKEINEIEDEVALQLFRFMFVFERKTKSVSDPNKEDSYAREFINAIKKYIDPAVLPLISAIMQLPKTMIQIVNENGNEKIQFNQLTKETKELSEAFITYFMNFLPQPGEKDFSASKRFRLLIKKADAASILIEQTRTKNVDFFLQKYRNKFINSVIMPEIERLQNVSAPTDEDLKIYNSIKNFFEKSYIENQFSYNKNFENGWGVLFSKFDKLISYGIQNQKK